MVTGRNKRALEDHFDRAYELEAALEAKGDDERLAHGPRVRRPRDRSTTCARATRKGLGHAVLCAAQHVGDEPFAVLLGDDLIDAARPAAAAHDRGARASSAAASSR